MRNTPRTAKLAAYVRHGNRRVHGWLERGAIDMICRFGRAQIAAGIDGHVAEIGIHHGRLCILLTLLSRPGEATVAVDLFSRQELNSDRSGDGDLAVFRKNMARHADTETLVVREGPSEEIVGRDIIDLAGGPIRLFSVDGGHSAATTLHDLETAEAALAPRGLIILDDCFNEFWPDVSTGLHVFLSTPRRVVPFAIGGNKTFLASPEAAGLYNAALAGCGTVARMQEFTSHPVNCLLFERPPLAQVVSETKVWKAIRGLPGITALRHAYRHR
jgi:hypothetical protein